jgi:hypothetical protein
MTKSIVKPSKFVSESTATTKTKPNKWEWSRDMNMFGNESPVLILTRKDIGMYAGSYLGGFDPIPSSLKNGLKQEGKCWLIRRPSLFTKVKVNKSVIENSLGLKVYDVQKEGRTTFYLVDEAAARGATWGLVQ